MISVVVFKWKKPGYRSTFLGRHVNTMRSMVARHYPEPHRFICVTDDPEGIEAGIEIVPLWSDHEKIANPTWPQGPSCYRRLKLFARDAAETFGERIVQVDLDMVFTADLRPLWERPEPFVIWGTGNARIPLCASMLMLRAGSLPQIWDRFDPAASPGIANRAGYRGSDQGWISYCLAGRAATWTKADGVYSYRDHVLRENRGQLYPNARAVIFHGIPDPWDRAAQLKSPWILEHYR